VFWGEKKVNKKTFTGVINWQYDWYERLHVYGNVWPWASTQHYTCLANNLLLMHVSTLPLW